MGRGQTPRVRVVRAPGIRGFGHVGRELANLFGVSDVDPIYHRFKEIREPFLSVFLLTGGKKISRTRFT
jgi:hypothetical protein